MSLFEAPHQKELREAGWHSRGYLPHFDGRPMPQFITLHLADSIPKDVIERWQEELVCLKDRQKKEIMQRRIEHYLDQGYGQSYLRIPRVAEMVQASLLKFNNIRYQLFAWVVMPNHLHCLLTRFEKFDIAGILHSLKSYTAHEANKMLSRKGQFWWEEYFDRYIRDADHFRKTVKYIENNPVKAGLVASIEEYPWCGNGE